ncbi:AAA family ATPase [Streptomyces sp. NPDC054841]
MLAEREDDTARLERFYEESISADPSGRCRFAVISGAPGSGRTELLHHLTDYAAARGGTVMHATTAPEERHLPYAVLEQLLRGTATGDHQTLNQLRFAMFSATSHVPWRIRLAVQRALLADRPSRAAPVLLTIDDIQFADSPSLQCLAHLLRHAGAGQLTVVATHRDAAGPRTDSLPELTGVPGALVVRPRPLSPAGVGTVLGDRLGPAHAARFARHAHALTGGSPLLLSALLSDHLATRTQVFDVAPPQPGELFRQAVLAGVHDSGRSALKAARGLALLGETATPALLGALTGLADAPLRQGLAALREAGVLDGDAFRHPVARAALLDDVPVQEQARLRYRAAELLRHGGATPRQVADQLMAVPAGYRRPSAWACRVLTREAERTLADGDMGFAERCLGAAEGYCSIESERLALRAYHAQLSWRLDPSAAAQRVHALVPPTRDGVLPPTYSLHIALRLLWYGHMEDAAAAYWQAAAAAHSDGADQRLLDGLAMLRQLMAVTYPGVRERCGLTGPYDTAGQAAPRTAAALPRWQAMGALASALRPAADAPTADAPTAADPEEALLRLRVSETNVEVLEAGLLALVHTGRLDSAETWCGRLLEEARELGTPVTDAVVTGVRALVALHRGRLLEAARDAEYALERISAQCWGVGIGLPLSVLIEAGTAMGRHEAVTELLDRPVPREMAWTRYGLAYLYARGRHQLATGRAHAALADFMECGERMERWGMDVPSLAPWRAGAAEVWLALDEPARAARFAVEQLRRTPEACRHTRSTALRVLAATRPSSARRGLLEQALETARQSGDAYETARTLADLGKVHKEQGDVVKGRLLVRHALRAADECGAEKLYRSPQPSPPLRRATPAAEAGPERKKVVPEGEALTAAERRVASLAARGYTNREIAGKLFITVSTVEQHLTRVYRKINIRRRQDLSASLDHQAAESA